MCVVCNSSTTGETFFLVGRARTGEGRDNVNEKNNVVRCSMMMMMMTVGITHGNRRILTYHHSRPERWETVRRRRPTIPSQRSTTVGEKGSIWMASCRHVSKTTNPHPKKMTCVRACSRGKRNRCVWCDRRTLLSHMLSQGRQTSFLRTHHCYLPRERQGDAIPFVSVF